ncbi:MAG: type II toxin-antitoxin system RelE/ParE family toxin [Alphaproteobacteria bacterium]|nr:type II toxin-antitoxin system RelE/ParE family toxin [Alphaproteobacteria bacterium]MCZ6592002.1 type II toxin-antitoxin system RelE/ParE family toxin [Alphaproteobacteria bacterium]MCZ6840524.1 type II toxin-antitoxin system RelE/ParE family toxin [Alphaproteobacteria bacterium]
MALEALLTEDAERDLEQIYDYIVGQGDQAGADRILDKIEQAIARLARHPDRGSYPKELLDIGMREYRQILFDHYRLIYRVIGDRVIVYLIVDGRRDLQSLLARRLF